MPRIRSADGDAHRRKGGMDGCTANLDCHDRVESSHRRLEWLQVAVLVREDAEVSCGDPKADTRMYVLLRGLEPSVGLCLHIENVRCEARHKT